MNNYRILLFLIVLNVQTSLAQPLHVEIHPLKILNSCFSGSVEYNTARNILGCDMVYYSGSGDNNYRGIKLAPLFRIYEEKVKRHTSFIDLKAVGGYMHSSVPYYDPHGVAGPDEIHIKRPYTFLGLCVGMGYKWDLGKNVYIRYSVCLQINKRLLKNKITYQNRPYETGSGGILPGDADWYLFGPGSILDLKLAIGLL